MITGLVPFVLFHYGETTKQWFSSNAMLRSQGSKWDAENGTCITPNNKVVQDGLSSLPWWMRDALTGIEDQDEPEPSRPVGRNSKAASHRMTTGSQVTFSQNMETTHTYHPDAKSKAKDNMSESSSSSDPSESSADSTAHERNKGQTAGNSTSEEESGQGSGSGSGSASSSGSINSDSNTAAIRKILAKNPQMLQKLINGSKATKKPKKKKPPSPSTSLTTKITPNKPKKAGSLLRGAGKNS
jgi:hypothetical protein